MTVIFRPPRQTNQPSWVARIALAGIVAAVVIVGAPLVRLTPQSTPEQSAAPASPASGSSGAVTSDPWGLGAILAIDYQTPGSNTSDPWGLGAILAIDYQTPDSNTSDPWGLGAILAIDYQTPDAAPAT